MAASTHEKKEAETAKTDAISTKATSEGDLAQTEKDLALAEDVLANVGSDCMQKASDHEVSTKGRTEELAALAKAKKIIQETSSGAEAQTYSLLQIDSSVISNLHTG